MADFEYNSQRPNLIIAEYGRHIQKMVDYCKTIEDKEQRQNTANAIVNLMNQMVPKSNKVDEDQIDKLWKHFFRIAQYDIDVDTPSGEVPKPQLNRDHLDRLPYSQSNLKYRHYGKNVMNMLAKAIEMEDGPKKEGFVHTIASYMKLAYKNWNKDHYVSDDNIVNDIDMMSKGKLILPPGTNLDLLGSGKNIPNNSNSSSSSRKRKNQSKRGGRRRKSNRY